MQPLTQFNTEILKDLQQSPKTRHNVQLITRGNERILSARVKVLFLRSA